MKLLREFNALSYDKDAVKKSRAKNDGKIILSGILQRADVLNQNGRVYPRAILEREVRNYQKFINENRSLGECVPPGTEILIEGGWKKIEDVIPGEKAYTLNLFNNDIELQTVKETVERQHEECLYKFYSRTFEMTITSGHKVVLWDRNNQIYILTAEELREGLEKNDSKILHSTIKRTGVWRGKEEEYYQISDKKVKTEDWAAFLGIFIAEGSSGGSAGGKITNRVEIVQVKSESTEAIHQLLKKLPWKFSHDFWNGKTRFLINDQGLHNHLSKLGNCYQKFIPAYAKQWSPHLLEILFQWMLIGDGRNRKKPNGELIRELYTTSTRLANDTAELIVKLGSGASIHTRIQKDRMIEGREILAKNSKPLFIISEHDSTGVCCSQFKFEKIPYSGKVYCVRVPNQTWLMKQNGRILWTHNCDHPEQSVVNLKNVSHVVREAKMENDGTVYGKLELLDTPSGKIAQNLVEAGITLGVSSRGVGSTKQKEGADYVQEDFVLICWDLVQEPSTSSAFLLPENKIININNILNKSDRIDRIINDILSWK